MASNTLVVSFLSILMFIETSANYFPVEAVVTKEAVVEDTVEVVEVETSTDTQEEEAADMEVAVEVVEEDMAVVLAETGCPTLEMVSRNKAGVSQNLSSMARFYH